MSELSLNSAVVSLTPPSSPISTLVKVELSATSCSSNGSCFGPSEKAKMYLVHFCQKLLILQIAIQKSSLKMNMSESVNYYVCVVQACTTYGPLAKCSLRKLFICPAKRAKPAKPTVLHI